MNIKYKMEPDFHESFNVSTLNLGLRTTNPFEDFRHSRRTM
jgi:hypothetical protein